MQVYNPTKHTLKKAIQHLEWALSHLDDYVDELDSDNRNYEMLGSKMKLWAIDNCCYEIRDAYRDLKDLI